MNPLTGLINQNPGFSPYNSPYAIQKDRRRISFNDFPQPDPSLSSISLDKGLKNSFSTESFYNYLDPASAISLFLAGLASSFALKWIFLGNSPVFSKGKLFESLKKSFTTPLKDLLKNAHEVSEQTATIYSQGLVSVLMFALNASKSQQRLKAYLGSIILGYVLGSAADGVHEIWVRREETQIRTDLQHKMSISFRKSFQYKNALDAQLRDKTRQRIVNILKKYNVPYPEELLKPVIDSPLPQFNQFPYKPVHFSVPFNQPSASYRFGVTNQQPGFSPDNNPSIKQASPVTLETANVDNMFVPSAKNMKIIKVITYTTGFICGLLGQTMLDFMKQVSNSRGTDQILKESKRVFYRIFNINNLEALFLTAPGHLLLTVLGLTALAKLGKMIIDGYKEIEVTRRNANTELRYQTYNWQALDPAFHQIAEEESVNDDLRKLEEALPYEYYNRKALEQRIENILTNIGRNSAPKYFPMTPGVSLVAARG